MNDCMGFWFLLPAPGPFSCYLLSPWSKKNNAMDPRAEQHRPVMWCETASRVVRAEESGGGQFWARSSHCSALNLTLYHSQSAAGQ